MTALKNARRFSGQQVEELVIGSIKINILGKGIYLTRVNGGK